VILEGEDYGLEVSITLEVSGGCKPSAAVICWTWSIKHFINFVGNPDIDNQPLSFQFPKIEFPREGVPCIHEIGHLSDGLTEKFVPNFIKELILGFDKQVCHALPC
jgi:hypothetical protein